MDPADEDATVHEVLSNVSVGLIVAPGWLTATVWVAPEEPDVVNVTVAERDEVDVFAVAASVTDPLFDPEAGETVSQDWLDETTQSVFDVTPTVFDAAEDDANAHDVLSTVRVGVGPRPSCVTLTVADAAGLPVTVVKVMVPVRGAPLLA